METWIINQVSIHISDLRSSFAFVDQPLTRQALRDFLCDRFCDDFSRYPTDEEVSQIFEATKGYISEAK